MGISSAGLVVVAYEATETSWRLVFPTTALEPWKGQLNWDKGHVPGLGTIIVAALAKQLDARVEIMRSKRGTTASVAHETPGFRSRMPEKASR